MASNGELSLTLATLDRQLATLRGNGNLPEDSRGSILQKEQLALVEQRNKHAELTAELEDKKQVLENLRAFAFKLVSEFYKHLRPDNDRPMHELYDFLKGERFKMEKRESLETEDNLTKIFKSYAKSKALQNTLKDTLKDSEIKKTETLRKTSRSNQAEANFRPTFLGLDHRRGSLGVQMIEEELIQPNKVIKLKAYNQLKKNAGGVAKKDLIGLCNRTGGKKDDPEDDAASINSDIDDSVLQELDEPAPADDSHVSISHGSPADGTLDELKPTKSVGPKKRDYTTLKISFKIDIQNAPTKPGPYFEIKKDRIHKSFHLREMEFHLDDMAVCGVILTFYDTEDDALFLAEMHGVRGEQIERVRFEPGELISKIRFASDNVQIHHIEIETTLGRSLIVGKSKKEALSMGLQIVNRYFSDKDMLFSFFGGFDIKSNRIAYLRFLFVRKNMIK